MTTIKSVWFKNGNISVEMSDGSIIENPINNYPNLSKGTTKQINNYQIKGNGRWIHWEELDEDLSAEGFLSKR
ncbi:MAG: DUF2442 domain-containing protein [Sphingobacteriales bacterium]